MPKLDFFCSTSREPGLKRAKVEANISGNNTVVAAVAGKRIRVYQMLLIAAGTVTADVQSSGGTDLTGPLTLAANVGFSTGWCPVGHFETADSEALRLALGSAVAVGGWVVYAEV